MLRNLLLFSLVIIFLSACSSKKTRIYNKKQSSTLQKKVKQTASKNSNYKTKALYEEYNKWLGTKYKLGGQSLSGVDCSSFIQQVYLNVFGLKIPRTTKKQAKSGYEIVKKELHAGDMIFFKTGWDVRHVGIIIENGKFIHTSTKRGVSMSSIHNPYWRGNYWQSRRVLP